MPRRLKPPVKVELSQKNIKLRIVLIVVCAIIAILALVYGLLAVLNQEPGWKVIEAEPDRASCADDFVLNYYLGDAGISSTAEHKKLVQVYTQATEDAFRIFETGMLSLGTKHNQSVTIDPALYQALQLCEKYDNRSIYLAPVYDQYGLAIQSETEAEAARYDPTQAPEQAAFVAELAAFAADPEMVRLELLGKNQVRLNVSDTYLAYLREHGITELLDFGWMKNAFIADYLAQKLAQAGFTSGYLASYDGFTRNLDKRGLDYEQNIFDRRENTVYQAAKLHYDKPLSIVILRNYPISSLDRWHYFSFATGRIVTLMIDPADGKDKSATDNLLSYSRDAGCAEILLQVISLYVADEWDEQAVNALTKSGVYSIWTQDKQILYNDPNAKLSLLNEEGADYTKALAK